LNRRLLLHSEQDPLSGNALQRVGAKIDEPNPRSGHEILHRSGDTHFAWSRSRRDASGDMHRNAGQVSTHQLAFTRMQARPDLNPERPHRRSDGLRTTNRPRGAIEPGHEAVTSGVDLDTAMDRQLTSHQCVVSLQQVSPSPIAKRCRAVGGSHDVSEENSRQDPIGVGCLMRAGEELLDLVGNRVVVVQYPSPG
jgi:hypothetical protein